MNKNDYGELFNDVIIEQVIKLNEFGNLNAICLFEPQFHTHYDEEIDSEELLRGIVSEYNDKLSKLKLQWRFRKYEDELFNTALIIERSQYELKMKSSAPIVTFNRHIDTIR